MVRKLRPIPIGNSSFQDILEKKQYYVDKSLLIKEILDSGSLITLITRPRRFGKTLNLSMLKCFFEADLPENPFSTVLKNKIPKDRKKLFQNLAIYKQGDEYTEHQGKYPVIFFSLKDAKDSNWETCFKRIQNIISNFYKEHKYLLGKGELDKTEEKDFEEIVNREASMFVYKNSLFVLISHLKRFYKKNVIVLIDEYDTPVHEAYEHGFYPQIIDFLRAFLGSGLKDNVHVERAVITGILRVTKETIFSDLNNPDIITVLSDKFADKFGYTEEEVVQFLKDYGIGGRIEDVRNWYNGYVIGKEQSIYNPWSINNFIDKHSEGFQAYWVNTSKNTLVNHLLARGSGTVKNELESLLSNKPIIKKVNSYVVFSEIEKTSESLWSFLLFTGYLKVLEVVYPENIYEEKSYKLAIPNVEVSMIYRKFIYEWFTNYLENNEIASFFRSLLSGDVKTVRRVLKKYVLGSMSFFDPTGKEAEKVYHAFVLGMLVNLKTHKVKSNRESGFGRYDIMLIPVDRQDVGVVIEFKKLDPDDNETLEMVCEDALHQINELKYETELQELGVSKVYKYGVAFEGKNVLVKMG